MTPFVHPMSCNIIQDNMNDLPFTISPSAPVLRCILVSVAMVIMVLW